MGLPNEPYTRREVYLSNIAGQNTALPAEPYTREEEYLDYIAKNGSGGGIGEGDMKKSVYDSDLAVSGAGGIKAYVTGAIADKVDKVDGKGLSTNDYDDSAKAIVDGVTTALDGKVSKSNTAGLLKNDGSVDTTTTSAVSANTTAISNIKDGTSIDSFSDVETALSGKENTISDLSTIRSGASAGATAYQKPNDGIPKTDLASAVQTSLSKADSAVQDISGKADKVASATNGNFAGLDSNGNLTDSGKKSSDFATAASVTAIEGKIPSGASSSNKMATASDVTTVTNGVIANTKLIKDTVGWSGKNIAEKIVVDNHKENNYTALFIDGDLQPNTVYKLQFSNSNGNVYYTNQYLFTSETNVTADGTKILTLTTKSTVSKSDVAQYENGYGYKILKNRNAQSEFPAFSNVMLYDGNILDDTYEPYFGSTAIAWADAEGYVGKNLFDNKAVTKTENGVTFTVNADKIVSTSGASTGSTYSWCDLGYFNVSEGEKYKLSGCPDGGSDQTYNIYGVPYNSSGTATGDPWVVNNSGATEFTVPQGVSYYKITLRTYRGVTVTGKVFKPMITKEGVPTTPYEPYIPDNTELMTWEANAKTGVHNQADLSKTGGSTGLTISDITDNGFTIGFPTGSYPATRTPLDLIVGEQYTLSFKCVSTTNNNVKGGIRDNDSMFKITAGPLVAGTSYSVDFTYAAGDKIAFFINGSADSASTAVITDIVVKPKEDTSNLVTPYAMTNRELTEKVTNKVLSSTDDLDNIIEQGTYIVTSAPTHSPENKGYYTMLVYPVATDGQSVIQLVLHGENAIYYRRRSGSPISWKSWVKVEGSVIS